MGPGNAERTTESYQGGRMAVSSYLPRGERRQSVSILSTNPDVDQWDGNQ